MKLSGHQIGLLKGYMHDLVEQAKQDEDAHKAFGFAQGTYRPDEALSDLLAILDDRIESEGVEVGLREGFLHHMWTLCEEAQVHVRDRVWLETNVKSEGSSKAATRKLAYKALIEFIETGDSARSTDGDLHRRRTQDGDA